LSHPSTNTQEVLASLREAKSGISRAEDFAAHGFRCQVQGMPTLDPAGSIDAERCVFSVRVRLESCRHGAGDPRQRVEEKDISNPRTGIVMGSGGSVDQRAGRRGRYHAQK